MALPKVLGGRRRRLFARLLANGLGQAAAVFAVAWLIRRGLDGDSPLWPTMAGLGLAAAMLMALRVLERIDAERLGLLYVGRVRLALFRRIAAMPARGGARSRHGLTMTRLVADLNALKNWVSAGAARLVVGGVSLAGSLAALAVLSLPLAGAAAAVLAAAVAVALGLRGPLSRRVGEARRRRGRLAGNLGEKVLAAATVAQFDAFDRETARLRRQNRRLIEAMVARMRLAALIRALPDAALPLTVAAMLAAPAVLPDGGGISPGTITAGLFLVGLMTASLRDLALALDYRLTYHVARARIGAVLERPVLAGGEADEAASGTASGTADSPAAALSFEGAHCRGALAPFAGCVAPGERVLVTGPSGAGKSTLIGLAARLFDPDTGAVLLDGRPLPDMPLAELRRQVGLASPALPLLRGTVADNVAYGGGAGVAEALALCRLDGAGPGSTSGAETRVVEGGRNLAAGLAARVGLARALAGLPRLLLIDDPTFASDPAARDALTAVLRVYEGTVLIAGTDDRLAPLVDRVWRLEAGDPA
jgi:ABC-type multidrug transport system fused ATPase/permease subunit